VCSTHLKKILEWLKMVAKLPKLLPRRSQEDSEPEPVKRTDLDQILGAEIQRKQAGERAAAASRDPNMPRYQPCRKCRRPAKRTDKAQLGDKVGAFYKCSIHGEFFVGR
jgi:hypothetical protein